jgi:butyryl-CoA dehydrogenase
MHFELTEEQRIIKENARRFAQEVLAPRAEHGEETGEWPYDIWEQMRELGYTGVVVPEEFGGVGMGILDSVLILEEFARADDSFATSYQVHNLICDMFLHYASEEQRNTWLPILASGEKMGAFALTEPNAGSDAYGIQTRAVLENGEWVINGTKIFITNAGLQNSMGVILMAVTGQREDNRKEVSSILVPKDTPGFIIGNKFKKIGWNIMDTRELIFEDCRVPADNLFGVRGKGIAQALGGLNLGRIDFGAIGTGVAQAALDYSLKYAQERVQFGQSLSKFQAIQFMLADMACNAETARLHTYKAAWLKDQGKAHATEATIAKLVASEMAHKNVMMGFQIHGGYGFMREYPISRLYRNVKMLEIGEGTSEICRIVISRALGC